MNDEILLQKLKGNDNASYTLFYGLYFPIINNYVCNNNGNTQDAEDIFQDVCVVVFQKLNQPGFTLTSSLKTYIYAIGKNLWLKKLRDNKSLACLDINNLESVDKSEDVTSGDRNEYVHGWLQKITANCQRILKAIFFLNIPMEHLMKKMGWKNKHTADNQKYKCLQQMKKVKEKETV